jgi:hypothetical protein
MALITLLWSLLLVRMFKRWLRLHRYGIRNLLTNNSSLTSLDHLGRVDRSLVVLATYVLGPAVPIYSIAQAQLQLARNEQWHQQAFAPIRRIFDAMDKAGAGDADPMLLDRLKAQLTAALCQIDYATGIRLNNEQAALVARHHQLSRLQAADNKWSVMLDDAPQLACHLMVVYLSAAASPGGGYAVWLQALYVLYLGATWSKSIAKTALLDEPPGTFGLSYSLCAYLRLFLEVTSRLAILFLCKLAAANDHTGHTPNAPTLVDTPPRWVGTSSSSADCALFVIIAIMAIVHLALVGLIKLRLQHPCPICPQQLLSIWLQTAGYMQPALLQPRGALEPPQQA